MDGFYNTWDCYKKREIIIYKGTISELLKIEVYT